jgi:hypothetical protein
VLCDIIIVKGFISKFYLATALILKENNSKLPEKKTRENGVWKRRRFKAIKKQKILLIPREKYIFALENRIWFVGAIVLTDFLHKKE